MKIAIISVVANLILLSIYMMGKKILKEWKESEASGSNDPHDLFYH
jgi:hypothetical protein